MVYLVLTQETQEEILVEFLHAQERDHFCHTINRQRYAEMLKTLSTDDPFRARIQQLHDETVSRLAEVDAVMAETLPQVKDVDVAAVKARLDAKAALGRG